MIRESLDRLKSFLLSSENLLGATGGLIFVIVLFIAYSSIDSNWFEYRDDGVITMSVGKNLVEHGFLGVSPSGPIVEASSSPVQTFFYAITYYLTGMDYANFSYFQTYLFTFLIGYVFISFLKGNIYLSIPLTLLGAISLSQIYTFIGWHASGMENAITHFLFLITIYILFTSIRDANINYWLALFVFIATISRLDSVFHIALLLIIFSVAWYLIYKSFKAFKFSLIVFLLWLTFHVWRFFYYGDYLPNTAYAQGISLSDRLALLFSLDSSYLNSSLALSKEIFFKQGGVFIIAILPLLLFFRFTKENIFLSSLVVIVIFSSIVNPFIFGATRIDHGRTTTQMALVLVLFFIFIIFNSKNIKHALITIVLIFPSYRFLAEKYSSQPYYLGWSTNGFNNVRNRFIEIAKENSIDRPTVSNPDLGVMTWYKQVNVVDLGMLGSPIMAKLKNGPLLTEYYLKYAQPDIIEAHGYWIRRYCGSLFTNNKFQEMYSQVGSNHNMSEVCKSKKQPPMIFWIRKNIEKDSKSLERLFLNDLQENLSLDRIKEEVDRCDEDETCFYIARTVYKFIPELREMGIYSKVLDLFSDLPSQALINGFNDAQTHMSIIKKNQENFIKSDKGDLVINAEWQVFLKENVLTYIKHNCQKDDFKERFYLHFVPKDKNLLKEKGFVNLDFHFNHANGLVLGSTCVVQRYLPNADVDTIRTGQYSVLEKDGKKSFENHWKASYKVAN